MSLNTGSQQVEVGATWSSVTPGCDRGAGQVRFLSWAQRQARLLPPHPPFILITAQPEGRILTSAFPTCPLTSYKEASDHLHTKSTSEAFLWLPVSEISFHNKSEGMLPLEPAGGPAGPTRAVLELEHPSERQPHTSAPCERSSCDVFTRGVTSSHSLISHCSHCGGRASTSPPGASPPPPRALRAAIIHPDGESSSQQPVRPRCERRRSHSEWRKRTSSQSETVILGLSPGKYAGL